MYIDQSTSYFEWLTDEYNVNRINNLYIHTGWMNNLLVGSLRIHSFSRPSFKRYQTSVLNVITVLNAKKPLVQYYRSVKRYETSRINVIAVLSATKPLV